MIIFPAVEPRLIAGNLEYDAEKSFHLNKLHARKLYVALFPTIERRTATLQPTSRFDSMPGINQGVNALETPGLTVCRLGGMIGVL
jgi:hypothetical protein